VLDSGSTIALSSWSDVFRSANVSLTRRRTRWRGAGRVQALLGARSLGS